MATTVQTVAYPTVAQPQIVVPANNPHGMNVKSIRGLGITQIVIGALTVLLGIIAIAVFEYGYWVNGSGSGIWFGIWILITGIIGVMSAKNPQQTSLNGVNMGFSIVCCVVSFFVGIFYIVALVYYSNCESYWSYNHWTSSRYQRYDPCYNDKDSGTAIYAILMILMIAEFFISMAVSIVCCQNGCCRSSAAGGVIIQQQPGPTIVSSTGVVMSSQAQYPAQQVVYPPQSVAGYPPQSVAGYPPQSQVVYPAGGYPNQQYVTTAAPMGGVPQPAYSNQMPPQDPSKVAPPPPYTS